MSHINLQRDGRRVLQDLNWRIQPGERWVLTGGNGAGKTQLLKLLAGDVWPQSGSRIYRLGSDPHVEHFDEPRGVREEIAYIGAERQDRYEHYAWNHRVTTVVATGLSRTDIPLEPLRSAQRQTIGRMLQRLGLSRLAGRRFLTLSYGERRLVLLVRALARRPGLLLVDEPLNGLDAAHREQMLRILAGLQRAKLPWVYATHRLNEIPAGATHITVLRHGKLRRRAWPSPGRQRAEFAHGGAGSRVGHGARSGNGTPAPGRVHGLPSDGEPDVLFRLRDVWVWREGVAALRGVSLSIARGDCWVVHGANGSGKSTLLAALLGAVGVASSGELWRRGQEPGVALLHFQRRVGYVTPELQAALPRQAGVVDIVVAGLRQSFGLDEPGRAVERRRAAQALRKVGAAGLARRICADLSYGQMRRVLFARALVASPDILLLDEPYTGLDASTRSRLLKFMDSPELKTHTMIVVTHHKDDWPRRATHELELAAGRVRYCGPVRRAH